jgi:hypothetical protein
MVDKTLALGAKAGLRGRAEVPAAVATVSETLADSGDRRTT